jgi:predicted transcriptional regulator
MSIFNPRLRDGFGQCSSTVMRDPALVLRDKAVYAYLCIFADSQTNQTTVSVFKAASELDISSSTVIRSLKSLESCGIIKRINRGRGKTKLTILLK